MGLFKKRCYGTVAETKYVSVNPNPKHFTIEKLTELENTYAEVRYPLIPIKKREPVSIVRTEPDDAATGQSWHRRAQRTVSDRDIFLRRAGA